MQIWQVPRQAGSTNKSSSSRKLKVDFKMAKKKQQTSGSRRERSLVKPRVNIKKLAVSLNKQQG